jgi:DNA-binding MarR family transcriptional regulator
MNVELEQPAASLPHSLIMITNHTHVLVQIARHPEMRMREIAAAVGITERAVQRIVEELHANGYIVVTKDGRRNRYSIEPNARLHHPLTRHRTVGDLIRFIGQSY